MCYNILTVRQEGSPEQRVRKLFVARILPVRYRNCGRYFVIQSSETGLFWVQAAACFVCYFSKGVMILLG